MPQESFIPGQRWISDTEPELGIGTILELQGRRVILAFPASGERRVYARDNAPLTRVRFGRGDRVESCYGWSLRVEDVEEQAGRIRYSGHREDGRTANLAEEELSDFLPFSRPQERLLTGQLDDNQWFELRHQTLEQRQYLEQSPLLGLCGARTSLLPHQLYIANEVSNRFAPRVLLADEVGLGKTIEAGLILHRQLLTGRASRALILVPPPLLHQWLVELLRRFNLHFSLFDEERYQAADEARHGPIPDEIRASLGDPRSPQPEATPRVVLWGSGRPYREFLHVDDLADACLFLLENYDEPDIINIGVGEDLSIAELAELVRDIVGFAGEIEYDASKPDGTPRKLVDTSKINALGWKASTGLRAGVDATYAWFLDNADQLRGTA